MHAGQLLLEFLLSGVGLIQLGRPLLEFGFALLDLGLQGGLLAFELLRIVIQGPGAIVHGAVRRLDLFVPLVDPDLLGIEGFASVIDGEGLFF